MRSFGRSSVGLLGQFFLLGVALSLACHCGTARAGDPSEYGIESLAASLSTTQAGAHPDLNTLIELKTDPAGPTKNGINPPFARTRDLSITLPPGMIGNPTNFPKCTVLQLGFSPETSHCPQDSQVGISEVSVYLLNTLTEPVYLMEPPEGGDIVARLGFIAGLYPTILDIRLKPEEGYSLEARVEGANGIARLVRADTTLWGVPAAKEHDPQRVTAMEAFESKSPPGGGRESGLVPAPFITNPTRCDAQRVIKAETDSYAFPGQFVKEVAPFPGITGCGKLTFDPKFTLTPTTDAADSPSGIDAHLSLSQEGLRLPNVYAAPDLKKATVTLPSGMTLNPASANGLGACTEAQVGLISENPIRFDSASPSCPESSKVGTAEIQTPVLEKPIQGALYLASQSDNPFHTLLSGYLVAEGQGVVLKLAGRFDVDPETGQITATFDENPEAPVEDFVLHFKSGSSGVVTTPGACGSYEIHSLLTPWSAANPFEAAPPETVASSSAFSISRGPNGGPCPTGAFSAQLEAGTTNPTAGEYSSFMLRLTREDGTPRLKGLNLTLPEGLTGKLAGIPYCPDSAIQASAALAQPGQGGVELSAPACPAASQVGTVTAGAGSGPAPFYISTGKVYLAGPYKGAPLSFVIVTPAVAGPFDLGTVVVRTALEVDETTAKITAVSDPLPTVVQGIPLDLRDVRVNVDRSRFILNPTSCQPKSFKGTVTAVTGAQAPLSERFQAASCASLGFKPKLTISLKGGMKRTGHPALKAVLAPRQGDANLAGASVTLPPTEFIDQAHVNSPCTRVQFNAGRQCPAKSVLGRARVWTPLLDHPLEGPVYFRSNGGERLLPDIVLDLHGQIPLVQVGFVDSTKNRIRTTFASVPDAPVSKIVLNLKGGKQGLLINNSNLCASKRRARVHFAAQNGRRQDFNPVVKTSCRK